MGDLDLTKAELTTNVPEKTPYETSLAADPLQNVSTEELLETALERLAGTPDSRYALAASHVEEALRQVRKPARSASEE